jgi:hypothetical protein
MQQRSTERELGQDAMHDTLLPLFRLIRGCTHSAKEKKAPSTAPRDAFCQRAAFSTPQNTVADGGRIHPVVRLLTADAPNHSPSG